MKSLLEQLGWVVAPEAPEPPKPQETQDSGDDDAEERRIYAALESPMWCLENEKRSNLITVREIAKLAKASEHKTYAVIKRFVTNCPRWLWMFRL